MGAVFGVFWGVGGGGFLAFGVFKELRFRVSRFWGAWGLEGVGLRLWN